jgi:hypothetical protein
MTRLELVQLADDAKRFDRLTGHLRFAQGERVVSVALILENERRHDPLRKLMEKPS